MLTSLLKFAFFIVMIAALTWGAGQLMDTDGQVVMQFDGREISLSPIQFVIGIVLLIVAIWLIEFLLGLSTAIFKFFNGDETAVSRYFGRNREKRGHQALAESMVALAAGEGKTAMSKAAQAERYLEKPQLTNLVNAQAAELSGDSDKALKYYKSLLDDDRTRFVGVQGIMKQKLADGDTDTALKLAEKALALRPSHDGTMDTLFDLQTEKSEWKGAQKTIEAKVRNNKLPRDVGKRRESVLAIADARELLEAGDIEAGKEAALRANKLSPGLVPAAVLAAEMHMLDNNTRAASSVLKKAWSNTPHPELAASFAEVEPKETPTQRIKRFAALTRQHANHSETKLLKAELALADEDFPAARRAARELAETEPTTRSLTIMAAIEKGEGADEQIVRGWLSKALSAPRGAQWLCSKCNTVHGDWGPRCDNCGGFDTFDWKTPAATEDSAGPTATLGFTAGMLTAEAEKVEPQPDVTEAELVDTTDAEVEVEIKTIH